LAERKKTTRKSTSSRSSSSKGTSKSSSRSSSRSSSSRKSGGTSSRSRSSGTRSRSTSTRKRSAASAPQAEAAAEEQTDPLAAQGYGEEDFSRRDYVIPGVDAQDPDPYKWHTGSKRDHGGEDAIEIIDLVKQFGRTRILNGCNLGLPDNMISMVLGPSGTGKSVLIKHIVGLLYPDAGDVLVHGESIPNMTDDELFEVRKKFGLLFQDGALFGSMNVYDNTCFPLRQHTDKSEEEIEEIVSQRLREVGLAEAFYKMPNELSGGMRKRAGFARALVLDPAIVMFDEPDSGLDPVRTALLCELIREVHDENGGCYLVISHDLGTARRIADFIAVLWKGRIVESGPSDELFNSNNEFVNQFLNADVKGPLAMD
jgi:phospholipid/cholesterol/gamma-HCH transport system ATP-binding protein